MPHNGKIFHSSQFNREHDNRLRPGVRCAARGTGAPGLPVAASAVAVPLGSSHSQALAWIIALGPANPQLEEQLMRNGARRSNEDCCSRPRARPPTMAKLPMAAPRSYRWLRSSPG